MTYPIYKKENILKLIEKDLRFSKIVLPKEFSKNSYDFSLFKKSAEKLEFLSKKEFNDNGYDEYQPIGFIKSKNDVIDERDFFDKKILEKEYKNILILDKIKDSQNLASILNLSHSFSIDLIVIPKWKSAKINSTTISLTNGKALSLNLLVVNSTLSFVKKLKKYNYSIIGTDPRLGEEPTKYFKGNSKFFKALILGSEDKGISPSIKNILDKNIKIEMKNSVESLNVSNFASILLFSLNYF